MKITLDDEVCQKHAQCVMACPEVFGWNEDNTKVLVLNPSPEGDLQDAARDAADLCPVIAITIDD